MKKLRSTVQLLLAWVWSTAVLCVLTLSGARMNIFLMLWKVLMCSLPGDASRTIYSCRIFYFCVPLNVVFWMLTLYIVLKTMKWRSSTKTVWVEEVFGQHVQAQGGILGMFCAGQELDLKILMNALQLNIFSDKNTLSTVCKSIYISGCWGADCAVLGEHSEELLLFLYPLKVFSTRYLLSEMLNCLVWLFLCFCTVYFWALCRCVPESLVRKRKKKN